MQDITCYGKVPLEQREVIWKSKLAWSFLDKTLTATHFHFAYLYFFYQTRLINAKEGAKERNSKGYCKKTNKLIQTLLVIQPFRVLIGTQKHHFTKRFCRITVNFNFVSSDKALYVLQCLF